MIDLRSDTVTKPSQEMREAMMAAPVGDDVYGDDETVNSLEARVAQLFGKEAALFTPSGSLANQLALRMLVKPGEELLAEVNSHVVRAELGAAAVFSGITTRTWHDPSGVLNADRALEFAKPNSGPYLVSTAAIAIENTHNFGGGTIQPISEIAKLREGADALGLALHLDGARIWNAHVVTGIPLDEYGKYFDTISVCLSKGLGAPIGSLMLSTHERTTVARQWRKRYGAGMRQVGMLAGAAHYALDHNISRLRLDHAKAQKLALCSVQISPLFVDPTKVETNIVAIDLSATSISATEINAELKANGILGSVVGPKTLRLVTHLDVSDEEIDIVTKILPGLLQRALMAK